MDMDKSHTRSLDDVRACAGKLTGVQGLGAVLQLLEQYSATRICEVPETHYSDFVERCELLVSSKDQEHLPTLFAEGNEFG
jgi:hypothetical protein